MSISAYRRVIKETEEPRDLERRILSRITANLSVHQDSFDNSSSKTERIAILSGSLRPALSENLKIWSALKADLLSPGNGLSEQVRADLISLAMFVERHTSAVLAGKGRVRALVDVNRSIIDGLSGKTPEGS